MYSKQSCSTYSTAGHKEKILPKSKIRLDRSIQRNNKSPWEPINQNDNIGIPSKPDKGSRPPNSKRTNRPNRIDGDSNRDHRPGTRTRRLSRTF